MAARGTPAIAAAAAAGVSIVVHEYRHDPRASSYGEEAASMLGIAPGRVFKTLVVDIDGRLAVAVLPVSRQLRFKSLAAALGGKRAVLAEAAAAERATGYVLGGISPLGQRTTLSVCVDESALDHPTIFVSGGRRGLEIEIAPQDLVALTRAAVAPLAA